MGWAQANLYYDKIAEPPEPGSLQEVVCILVQRRRRDIRLRELLFLAAEGPGKKQAWIDLCDASAPYERKEAGKVAERQKKIMDDMYRRGPLRIRFDR